jgi:hypothetical protein
MYPLTEAQKEYIEYLLGRLGWSVQFALADISCPNRVTGKVATILDQLSVEDASELIDYLIESLEERHPFEYEDD